MVSQYLFLCYPFANTILLQNISLASYFQIIHMQHFAWKGPQSIDSINELNHMDYIFILLVQLIVIALF